MHSLLNAVRIVPLDVEGFIEDTNIDRRWRLQAGTVLLPHFDALGHELLFRLHPIERVDG